MDTPEKLQSYCSEIKTVNNILECIERDGFVCIPSWLSDPDLDNLRSTFEGLVNNSYKSDHISEKGNDTVKVKVINKEIRGEFKEINHILDVFEKEPLSAIAQGFFKDNPYHFNRDIFVAEDRPGSKHEALDLHFDVRPTFKFFLYLYDTTEENGAFTVAPGTHHETRRIREEHGNEINYANRHLSRPINNFGNELSIELPAGSLVIFTTELFHRAGRVTKGRRCIMRSHSWLEKPTRSKSKNLLEKIICKFG